MEATLLGTRYHDFTERFSKRLSELLREQGVHAVEVILTPENNNAQDAVAVKV